MREFLPPWSKNSPIVWLGKDQEGNYRYIDLGYTDPHSIIRQSAIAALRGEGWEKKLLGAVGEIAKPFASENILLGTVLDVSRNKTADGRPVYNDTDTWENKLKASFEHVGSAFVPGTIAGVKRIYDATQDKDGKFGMKHDPALETVAQTTGIRTSRLDVRSTLRWRAMEAQQRIIDAGRLQKARGTETSVGQRGKVFDDMQKAVSAARVLGLDDQAIYTILKSAGMSAGLAGRFVRPSEGEMDRYNEYRGSMGEQRLKFRSERERAIYKNLNVGEGE
jgi:hypothetical protein